MEERLQTLSLDTFTEKSPTSPRNASKTTNFGVRALLVLERIDSEIHPWGCGASQVLSFYLKCYGIPGNVEKTALLVVVVLVAVPGPPEGSRRSS